MFYFFEEIFALPWFSDLNDECIISLDEDDVVDGTFLLNVSKSLMCEYVDSMYGLCILIALYGCCPAEI